MTLKVLSIFLKLRANIQFIFCYTSCEVKFFSIVFPRFAVKFYSMFHKNFKLIIAGLIIAFGIYQFTESQIGNGIALILFSGIFIFLYFKNEMILLAFLRLRKQDFEGTKKWLNRISNPEAALTQKQQGYFNYLHGLLLSQTNMTQAEKYFKRAIKLGLSMQQDLAMAKLNLAGIAMTKRRKREAQLLLKEAKTLDKHGMLNEQIQMMKQQMKRF